MTDLISAMRSATVEISAELSPELDHPLAKETVFDRGSCSDRRSLIRTLAGIADPSPTKSASCCASAGNAFVMPAKESGRNRATWAWSAELVSLRTSHVPH